MTLTRMILLTCLMLMTAIPDTLAAGFETGKVYHGFTLFEKRFV